RGPRDAIPGLLQPAAADGDEAVEAGQFGHAFAVGAHRLLRVGGKAQLAHGFDDGGHLRAPVATAQDRQSEVGAFPFHNPIVSTPGAVVTLSFHSSISLDIWGAEDSNSRRATHRQSCHSVLHRGFPHMKWTARFKRQLLVCTAMAAFVGASVSIRTLAADGG